MALILNIETSTEVCSVALANNGELLYEKESLDGLNHSELLTVFIETLFKKNKTNIKDIDAVAVSKGPGSFTGLRIGVSVAKGLCYALEKPLISIGTLDAFGMHAATKLALFYPGNSHKNVLLCPMIDARRMEVYTSIYDSNGNQLEPVSARIVDESTFSKLLKKNTILFFGNGAQKCKSFITQTNALFPGLVKASARFMINLSEVSYNNKEFEDIAYFEPFYLKDFIATIPKNKII